MYLFYIDESGDPFGWDKSDNFVLAGAAIHEGQVRRFSEQIDLIQQKYFPMISMPIELHASVIRSGKDRFRRMTIADREKLMTDISNIIKSAHFPNLILFATAIHVSAVRSGPQALRDCLEDICQRFNTFLVRQCNAGYIDKGLLIMDRSGRETRVRELMDEFRKSGTKYGHLGNVIDVPYFADSKHTRMLQLADFIAFAFGRYLNASDRSLFDMICGRIDRSSPGSTSVGFKHIIAGRHACSCAALH